MAGLNELNKSVGCLEGKVDMLIRNQDKLVISVDNLKEALKHKGWYDSAKIVGGAFCGGFAAVVMKLKIWG